LESCFWTFSFNHQHSAAANDNQTNSHTTKNNINYENELIQTNCEPLGSTMDYVRKKRKDINGSFMESNSINDYNAIHSQFSLQSLATLEEADIEGIADTWSQSLQMSCADE